MRYDDAAWIRPFGSEEGAGFEWGEGTASGDVINGSVHWANTLVGGRTASRSMLIV
jgi:hypothetical protein